MAIGHQSKAKGALGCWIVLSEWQLNEKGEWHIVDVQSAKVDGDKIKADTWYMLKDGMFVEADNNQQARKERAQCPKTFMTARQ